MSEKTTRRRLSERRQGKTDWKRVDALTDADIAEEIENDPDAHETDSDCFLQAKVPHQALGKLVDRDILLAGGIDDQSCDGAHNRTDQTGGP